jgi:antitoxin ParD1/3/4
MAFLAIPSHGTADKVVYSPGADMESMNISLPEPLKAFVDSQIASGRYSSASEYVRELIRADEKRKAEEQLEALLLAGLKGDEQPLTRADWQRIRQTATAQMRARRKNAEGARRASARGRA